MLYENTNECRRILLVDDETFIVTALARVLERRGFDVTATDSPLKALSLIDTEQFELVITDLKMYPVSGIDILERLKNSGYEGKTLVLSACPHDYEDDLERLAVEVVLEKPFELEIFCELVEQLTKKEVLNVWEEKKV